MRDEGEREGGPTPALLRCPPGSCPCRSHTTQVQEAGIKLVAYFML